MLSFFVKINNRGQSMIEAIIALAIFGLISSVMVSLATGGVVSVVKSSEQIEAEFYAKSGVEAIRGMSNVAWNEFIYNQSGIETISSSTGWQFKGEGTFDNYLDYERTISFNDVCRDINENIVDCPGEYTDLNSKKVEVTVDWGLANNITKSFYLTNWDSANWVQTNWVGGNGQPVWLNEDEYDSDDSNVSIEVAGEVSLKYTPSGSCGAKFWNFDESINYTYDNTKIEVSTGTAHLIASQGNDLNGQTLNSGFDNDLSNWTYHDWNQGGGDPDVNGIWTATGGNPDGFSQINLPLDLKNRTLGGYFEQEIVITDTPDSVSCEFDWSALSVNLPAEGVDELYVAVYLENTSGEPVGTPILRKDFNSTFGWESHSGVNAIDCLSNASSVGTYYYKIAVWIDGTNKTTGPISVGYDNAKVSWVKNGSMTYPNDNPDIYPNDSYGPDNITIWSGFIESANKETGEIYYQLSDDNGLTWQYWNGTNWSTAGETDYNIADIVNSNISSFSTSTGQIKFKAFLSSNGSSQVELDSVSIGCEQAQSWPFTNASNYIYNNSEIEVLGGTAHLLAPIGNCNQSPDSCGTFLNENSCTSQSGCSWMTGGFACQNNGSCSAQNAGQCNSCSAAGCNRNKGNCVGTLDCSQFNTQGSCTTCGQCSWAESSGYCDGTPTPCAQFNDQTNCENQSGCRWDTEYPTNNPSIYPTNSLSVSTSTLEYWSGFTEVADKGTGEIYYQLSDNDGLTWYYWNGVSWSIAGATDYNTAGVVNSNISNFSITTGKIKFKAFLSSDGTSQVELDEVRISWSENTDYGVGYSTFAYLISSAYNMGSESAVQVIEWDEDKTNCVSNCDIKFQLRTAPDNSGSPGTWTDWYGENGDGSYFTNNFGSLVSTDLNWNNWVQYRVELSGDGESTPVLEEVRVNYK